jgi:hypothetical protein
MEKPERKRGLSAPEEPATKSELGGWTPGEVADYIKFQLSELGGTNGHHDFEQLCFQLTKKRIYPNIIPSTGPVSAGGDQGSDFETFEVGSGGISPYFGAASGGKVVFACSLEKNYKLKIKADVVLIAKAQPLAKSVKFFSNGAVPVGIRHKLQEYAKTSHGIDLEVFDSLAVSTLLADPEVFWIATRFLSIPSEIFLAAPAAKSGGWYDEAKKLKVDPDLPRAADFFTIKRAVRYATTHQSRQSDLPSLIEKLRIFQAKQLPEIARRAFYEEFVAALRGLEFVRDCAAGLQGYFAEVPTLTDTAAMEDAAVLIHYAVGARKRGLLEIPMGQILGWRTALMGRIEILLAEDISPGRRSSLLDVKAFLTLLGWVEEVVKNEHADVRALASQSAARAFAIWRKMLKHVRESPMFPLEAFARRLAALAVEYGEEGEYEKLSQETDRLLASRAGNQKIGEQAFERAKAYCKAGRVLEAIDQLHIAHISTFTRETVKSTVYIPLFLAKLYAEAKLFTAAKHYALASSFAALKIGEDDLRPHIYRGLAEAAASDHANGASLGFFLTLKATVFVASQFSTSGSEKIQDFEWGRLYFYASILTYAASLVSKELADGLANDLLPAVGLGPMYDEALPDVKEFFASYTKYSDLATKATAEGAAPPFGDVPEVRKLLWRQLGIRWNVEWESDYHTTVMAESFIALLQILLTDLRKAELSLFPTQVDLTLKLHSAKLHIEEEPSNERVIRKVFLPKEGITPGLVFGIATTILMVVSAYPQDRFLSIIQHRVELGLPNKTNPHAPYDVLFREFYLEDDYEALHKLAAGNGLEVPTFMIETNSGLNGPSGIHSEYEPGKSRQEIENRYRRSSGLLKHTLPRLMKEGNFHLTVSALRSEGWKDWHILLATGGVRLNFVIDQILPKTANADEHMRVFQGLLKRDELESDPAPPPEIFTLDKLRFSLRLSQLSTLKGMGFDCWQQTPVTDAVDAFLRRFNYWIDDVPHADPFMP